MMGISAFFVFYKEATDGVSFAVFRKRARQRGRLSEKDKTKMFFEKRLKNDQRVREAKKYRFHKTCTKKDTFLCQKRQVFFWGVQNDGIFAEDF